jgi:hypothetical protein
MIHLHFEKAFEHGSAKGTKGARSTRYPIYYQSIISIQRLTAIAESFFAYSRRYMPRAQSYT